MNKLIIFTDGACENNPGYGSYGIVALKKNKVYKKSVYVDVETTNNRMEMEAIIEALKFAIKNQSQEVHIYSDSEYCVNGITKWIHTWLSKSKKMKNMDLWNQMYALASTIDQLHFHVVKGHSGVYGNELADELCAIALENKVGSQEDRDVKDNENFKTKPTFSNAFFAWKREIPFERNVVNFKKNTIAKDSFFRKAQDLGMSKEWLVKNFKGLKE